MSTAALGNDYVDNAKLTWHICARCLAWMATGEIRWLGLVGCCFPEPDGSNADLYQDFMDSGVLKCFRCWEKKDDCVVVSPCVPIWAILGRANPFASVPWSSVASSAI
jgi:hypothetical protein